MTNKKSYIEVKDHSVSGEKFQLLLNKNLDLLETTPQPPIEKLQTYYLSEDYISHTSSRRNVLERVYHLIRIIALRRKLKLINTYSKKSKNLLDIGCGTGDFLRTAQKNNWSVTGIEPNESARKIANKKTNNAVFNVEKLKELDRHSFDIITLWHVLEHLPNLQSHISIIKNLLKPTGTLIIAVPNYKSYDALYYKNFWAAFDAPRHLWHFSKTSIKQLFLKVQMNVIKTRPLLFDSFYVSLLSEKHKSGKMNVINAFRIGIVSNLKALHSGEYSSLIYIIKNG